MRIDSIKIKQRLIGAFLLVSLIALWQGLKGVSGLSVAKKGQDKMATNFVPSINYLHNIRFGMMSLISVERGLINRRMMDPQIRQGQYKMADSSWELTDKAWKSYDSIEEWTSKDEENLWNELQGPWKAWKAKSSGV